jgi:hypothetical protein
MSTSDQEQMSINVPMHKRIAQGAKLDGSSLQAKGESTPVKSAPKQSGGALAQARKK